MVPLGRHPDDVPHIMNRDSVVTLFGDAIGASPAQNLVVSTSFDVEGNPVVVTRNPSDGPFNLKSHATATISLIALLQTPQPTAPSSDVHTTTPAMSSR